MMWSHTGHKPLEGPRSIQPTQFTKHLDLSSRKLLMITQLVLNSLSTFILPRGWNLSQKVNFSHHERQADMIFALNDPLDWNDPNDLSTSTTHRMNITFLTLTTGEARRRESSSLVRMRLVYLPLFIKTNKHLSCISVMLLEPKISSIKMQPVNQEVSRKETV